MLLYLRFLLPAAALAATGLNAAAGQLNDTGMIRCADINGNISGTCKGTGQDGQYGRDLSNPANNNGALGFHFTRICNSGEAAGEGLCPAAPALGSGPNNWACTRDEVTGLTWEVKTTDGGIRDYRSLMLWPQIPGYLSELNSASLCGSVDWRAPTLTELDGLIWYGEEDAPIGKPRKPAVDSTWHPNLMADFYWTSVSDLDGSGFLVSYFDGTYFDGINTDGNYMRAVSGKPQPSRLEASDSEVIDPTNSLAWRRCAEGQAWNGATCIGRAAQYTWQRAIQAAKVASKSSGLQWRLPNAKELASLVKADAQSAPKINKTLFPGMSKNPPSLLAYWTSTLVATRNQVNSMQVYYVDFNNGLVNIGDGLSGLSVVRLVRDTK